MFKMLNLSAVILALAGVANVQAQPDKSQLVIGQLQFLTNFHPLIQVNTTKRLQINYGLPSITAYDEKAENQCVLCETLPTLDNKLAELVTRPDGTKGMKVTIKLKPGLAWGDGAPVTARDIAFTVKMANDPKIGFSSLNPWSRASSADVVDESTAVLNLPAVTPNFASWDQILPEHLEAPVYAKNPTADTYTKQTLYNTQPTNPGLWNGAYMLTDYQVGTRLVFEPNPHWPGTAPKLKKIILTFRDNNSALVQNLLSGDIDAVQVSPGGISFAQMLDVRSQYARKFSYDNADGSTVERIAVNFDNPILADLRVRKALLMGIDRQAIVTELFSGEQKAADGILPPSSAYAKPDLVKYPFDPKAAIALLKQAGWTPGADGVCVDPAGHRLRIELVTIAGNQTREQIAQVIQSEMKEMCVEIDNKFMPLQQFNSELTRKRQFSGLMMSSIDFSPSSSPDVVFSSGMIPNKDNLYVGSNVSGYSNAEMEVAVKGVGEALTRDAAAKAWNDVQTIFTRDLPFLPLYFNTRSFVTVPDLKDFNQGTYDPFPIWAYQWHRG